MRELRVISVAILVLLTSGVQSRAFGLTWVGGQSDDWNTPANWSPAGPPDPAGFPPNDGLASIGGGKTNYWPVIHNNHYNGSAVLPGPDAQGFNARCNLLSMPEGASYAQLTIDGGKMWFASDQYMIVGRHSGDTALLTINSGGIGRYEGSTLYGATRWLRIGRGDSSGGGVGTMIMNGGKVYAQAMSVGNPNGTGDAGSSATINSGGELYVGGNNYIAASFDVAANASMTVNPGGLLNLSSDIMKNDVGDNVVRAMGALNIVADATGSARLVVPKLMFDETALRNYFGYNDGSGLVAGNVNAIYNGGAGEFVFTYLGGSLVEITVIPEPATIALLCLGGLAVIRRKR